MTGVAKNTIEMSEYSSALTFFYHNFVRIRQTLRCAPAMQAGISDHKWSIDEMVDLSPETAHPIPVK